MRSKLFALASSDYVKACVLAVLTPVVGYLYDILGSGSVAIDWQQVKMLAVTSFLGYLLKNFLTAKDGKFLGRIG
jgi:hypothetical protein